MSARLLVRLAAVLALGAARPAFAGKEDEAIPYSEQEEDDDRRRELPRRSDPTAELREETDVEKQDREETLTHLDDPNLGLSIEVLAGLMLLDSSKGALAEGRFIGGVRFTWEFARLIPDEWWRETFFLDLMYAYTAQTEGTEAIWVSTNYHDVTVAPAFGLPLGGPKSPVAVYAQAGFGFSVMPTFIKTPSEALPASLAGTKFLFQYGGGFRFRLPLTADQKVRLSFRVEFTRFARTYMNDTLVGGSLGLTF